MNYKIKDSILWKFVDGETVMVDPDQESYLYLNSTGTQIWKMIDSGYSIEQINVELTRKYEVREDVVKKDIEEVIEELLEQGLIEKV